MTHTVDAVPKVPNLQRYREWRAYSQADLAKRADLSLRTVYAAEHDASISYRSLRKLAEALECEPNELTGQAWADD
jgi:DNA-binding XRE family transcriptional regulator